MGVFLWARYPCKLASGGPPLGREASGPGQAIKKEFFIDNLLVRIHLIIGMIRWTGLAPWEFEFPFPGSLTSTFLEAINVIPHAFL